MLADLLKEIEGDYSKFNHGILTFDDLLDIARRNDILVVGNVNLPKNKKSLILFNDGDRSAAICIAAGLSFVKTWYLLAHELGHFFLHSALRVGTVAVRLEVMNRVHQRKEEEAHLFATMCLLPNALVKKWHIEMQRESTSELRGVSLETRLFEKGLSFNMGQLGLSRLSATAERNIRNRVRAYRVYRLEAVDRGEWDLEVVPANEEPNLRPHVDEMQARMSRVSVAGRLIRF